jgi:hypothetical protein
MEDDIYHYFTYFLIGMPWKIPHCSIPLCRDRRLNSISSRANSRCWKRTATRRGLFHQVEAEAQVGNSALALDQPAKAAGSSCISSKIDVGKTMGMRAAGAKTSPAALRRTVAQEELEFVEHCNQPIGLGVQLLRIARERRQSDHTPVTTALPAPLPGHISNHVPRSGASVSAPA